MRPYRLTDDRECRQQSDGKRWSIIHMTKRKLRGTVCGQWVLGFCHTLVYEGAEEKLIRRYDMEDLSFGEQVKIILKRRGMTIKELAETIEERTGKVMSRQNLTQRLNRDNFQEQDMRLIAAILGCPFYLSIFPLEKTEDTQAIPTEETILKYADRAQSHKRGDTMVVETVKKAGQTKSASGALSGEDRLAAAEDLQLSDAEKADVAKALEIMQGESAMTANERDMTIGEVYGIYQELDEAETVSETDDPEEKEELSGQTGEITGERAADISDAPEQSAEDEDSYRAADETAGEINSESPEPEEKKETRRDIFHTGAIFLRKLSGQDKKEKGETRRFAKITDEDLKQKEDSQSTYTAKPMRDSGVIRTSKEPIPMDSEDFEPVLRYSDVEENLELGEMNPYTGHEYQSNSVRMHPTRIGYVQVYDRSEHGWTDMTEWAFLGHQERLKAKLGKDYREPIYLD